MYKKNSYNDHIEIIKAIDVLRTFDAHHHKQENPDKMNLKK